MSKHVLILGGHGKVAQLLTPILLDKSWTVTSLIRTDEQIPTIQKLATGRPGKLNVLVRSLDEVKSEAQAKAVLDEVKPDYVVWSAGAAGQGGAERTYAIDRDAAIYYIKAAASTPGISRFLMISYLASRRTKPAWWNDAQWASAVRLNSNVLPTYYQAKIAADEVLYQESAKRGQDFIGIDLRPGNLTLGPVGGVELGKTKTCEGMVSRASVAQVAAQLLEAEGVKNCWVDLLNGNEDINSAVKRVIEEGLDACEGEAIYGA